MIINVEDLAKKSGLSRQVIYYHINRGNVEAIKEDGRLYIDEESAISFLKRRKKKKLHASRGGTYKSYVVWICDMLEAKKIGDMSPAERREKLLK